MSEYKEYGWKGGVTHAHSFFVSSVNKIRTNIG
jgi:hypothetical protein